MPCVFLNFFSQIINFLSISFISSNSSAFLFWHHFKNDLHPLWFPHAHLLLFATDSLPGFKALFQCPSVHLYISFVLSLDFIQVTILSICLLHRVNPCLPPLLLSSFLNLLISANPFFKFKAWFKGTFSSLYLIAHLHQP